VDTWQISGKWELSDASPDRRLLALSSDVRRKTKIAVADPARKEIIREWPLQDVWSSHPLFADHVNAICALDGTGRHETAHCWDVESGKKLRRIDSGNPHEPMRAAAKATRAILSDYGWRIYFEGLETEIGSLTRRTIWDFGRGKEIASWKPSYQSLVNSQSIKEPYAFAIAPDGEMVAEGGRDL